ncbi:hypothetical protein FNV43_RR21913 [Rhamnella rubrinervis]|uniref:Uncharacterized protein n=1 Tax=Rhamnella rubrinervis TaxID=2594499 RepID=A0A8K0DQJ6_9ROSA|nr:hypothetical protein FNV43_RR21913 [Rhamnella rubrinervis]
MAASSPLSPKSQYHVRSNSLPSRPHPLIQKCNTHLARLATSDATSSSSSSISHKLCGLEDVHDCVDKLLALPLTQKAFVQGRNEKWVDELLDGSLKLLDLCSVAKDAVIHTKECTREVQSIIRTRRGGEVGLASEVRKYLASRKVMKKAVSKALGSLKGVQTKCSLSNKDVETTALVGVLREVEAVTLSMFETLLSFTSGTKAGIKLSGWSLVSKLMNSKKIGCDQEDETDVNEFAKVDSALQCLLCYEAGKSDSNKHIENVRSELQKLESCVQDLEGRLECLFRRLIKIRVSLLNILNN